MRLNFGGPYVGFFAAKEAYLRSMPGRLVGETLDRDGRRGFVLAVATREQHIRREKATSNICTNQALCALAALVYLASFGKQGLRELAEINLSKAEYAKKKLGSAGSLRFSAPTFNEFVLTLNEDPDSALSGLLREGIIGGCRLEEILSGDGPGNSDLRNGKKFPGGNRPACGCPREKEPNMSEPRPCDCVPAFQEPLLFEIGAAGKERVLPSRLWTWKKQTRKRSGLRK